MRTVFISSTTKDLAEERLAVRLLIESPSNSEPLKAILSEAPDFSGGPEDTNTSVYDICIKNVQSSDFFILLLHQKYGVPNQSWGDRIVSITHREYLEALLRHIPVFAFAHASLWAKYLSGKENPNQSNIDDEERLVIAFLAEIEASAQKKWIHHFQGVDELVQILQSTLLSYDGSEFLIDVSYPDGEKVTVGKWFKKTWRVKNTGMQVWKDRVLKEENPGNGLVPENSILSIPTTIPGQEVDLTVWLVAPKYPGTYISYWRVFDKDGRLCFPWKKGIWCKVNVVY